jgi:single-stranded-DNA-specific exonuclease
MLVQFGGHTLAAGLSVENEKINEFREKINEFAENMPRTVAELRIDCKLNPASINGDILSSIELLAPFGAENPQPVFGLYNMEITGLQPVGNGKHMRMVLQKNGCSVNAVMFSVSAMEFPFVQTDRVDVAVRLSLGEYMGKPRINVQIKDIKFSELNDEKVIISNQVYDDFCAGALNGAALNVTRELCAEVYRFMRVNNSWRYPVEALCYRLGLSADRIADCAIALDVLTELGILIYADGCYTFPVESVKNPIENSVVFNKAQKYNQ